MTSTHIPKLLSVTLLTVFVSGYGANAQDKKQLEADTQTLETCINSSKNSSKVPLGNKSSNVAMSKPEACIGIIANPCLGEEGNDTTVGMTDCHLREAAAWDVRLNAAYKKILALPQNVAEAYRKEQRAWIAFRDAACEASGAEYEGGTAAHVARASCNMELTARQALRLEQAGWER